MLSPVDLSPLLLPRFDELPRGWESHRCRLAVSHWTQNLSTILRAEREQFLHGRTSPE